MQGWIKLHRKVLESPVFNEPGMLKLWVYCLLKATHKPKQVLLGQTVIELKAGQFITGRNALARDYNNGIKPKNQVSEITLWRWLLLLEKMGNLNIKKTNKYSVVTIDNWAFYQEGDSVNEQQMNNKRTTNEHKQEVKEIKEINTIAEIENLRLTFSSSVASLVDKYWNVVEKTRKTNKVSPNVILKTMKKWTKFEDSVIHYSLKKHIEAYDDGEHDENYTLGIMRNTTVDQAEDFLSKKTPKKEQQQNLQEFDFNNLFSEGSA